MTGDVLFGKIVVAFWLCLPLFGLLAIWLRDLPPRKKDLDQ